MITIHEATQADDREVIEFVQRLLTELGGTNANTSSIDINSMLAKMKLNRDKISAFLAKNPQGQSIGVIMVVEVFAIYAGGNYGIINEMYVSPKYRSQNIGQRLIAAVKDLAQEKGWARIDVTAPPEKKWERSAKFYEANGFVFTGPKLKLLVK